MITNFWTANGPKKTKSQTIPTTHSNQIDIQYTHPKYPRPNMKTTRTLSIATLLFSFAASSSDINAQPRPSIGLKLASIDAGQLPKEDSPQVKRAALALRAASSRCAGTSDELADAAVVITQEVQRFGNPSTSVEILEGLDAILVDFKSPVNCTLVLSSYASHRRTGYTHSRAVVMQRELMKILVESGKRQ